MIIEIIKNLFNIFIKYLLIAMIIAFIFVYIIIPIFNLTEIETVKITVISTRILCCYIGCKLIDKSLEKKKRSDNDGTHQ